MNTNFVIATIHAHILGDLGVELYTGKLDIIYVFPSIKAFNGIYSDN